MKISFIDKFGDTVFIENMRDIEMSIEKYFGRNAVAPIMDFISALQDDYDIDDLFW